MRKRIAALVLVCGASLTIAAPASAFTIVNPVTGECRQVLVPGPGHGHANENTALGPVICP
jgi:hypothetical protein